MSGPVVLEPADDRWWCECDSNPLPHVHCPWGGSFGHLHIVDVETGRDVKPDAQQGENDPHG
jgi:hypothetical protein